MQFNITTSAVSTLDKEEIWPWTAEVKDQGRIHTRQHCSRSDINPCHLLKEFPIILSAATPAASCQLMGVPAMGSRMRLPSWPGALLVVSNIESHCHYCCLGGRDCLMLTLTFHPQRQVSTQRSCCHVNSPSIF